MKLKFEYQKKNKKRLSVFSGNEYLFSISELSFIKNNLKNGMEVADIEEFKKICHKSEAYSYCLNIIGKKDYTKKEIYEKLIKREISPEAADEIISELEEKGYVNEENYRDIYIKSKQVYKKDGFNKIRQDLYKKGIALEYDNYDKEAENENLRILIKDLIDKNTDDKKIIARLSRKGYKISDIIDKIKIYRSFEGEEEYDEY